MTSNEIERGMLTSRIASLRKQAAIKPSLRSIFRSALQGETIRTWGDVARHR